MDNIYLMNYWIESSNEDYDDIKTDKFDEEVKLTLLRRKIDNRIEPHIISINDYENDETPFVVEVKNTGIKVA